MSLAAREAARHEAEDAPGAVASTLGTTLALTAVVVGRGQSHPCSEVLFAGPLGQVGAHLTDELQYAVVSMRGQLREVASIAHVHASISRNWGMSGALTPPRLRGFGRVSR